MTLKSQRVAMWVALVLSISVFVSAFMYLVLSPGTSNYTTDMSDGWDLSINDEYIGLVDESEYKFTDLKRGDLVTLTRSLPTDIDYKDVIVMCTYLSAVEVWIDGEQVFEYGMELYNSGSMLGSGYHFVSVPESAAGQEIIVRITIGENDAFTSNGAITYGSYQEFVAGFISDNIFCVIISLFLVVLGVLIIVLVVCSALRSNSFVRFLPVGMLSYMVGMYSICFVKILEILGFDNYANTVCEYMSLCWIPTLALLVFYFLPENPPIMRRIMLVTAIILAFFALGVSFLHGINIIHISSSLDSIQVICAIIIIEAIISLACSIKRAGKRSHLSLIAFTAFCASGLFDLFKFNLHRTLLLFDQSNFRLLPFGALTFIILITVEGMLMLYRKDVNERERAFYRHMAYTDQLCEVANRAKFNEDIKDLKESDTIYAMILCDLNKFKEINDTFGHAKGDEVLICFAKLLKEAFGTGSRVYRIGGDEFVVIVRGEESIQRAEECLETIKLLEKKYSHQLGLKLWASYGAVSSEEVNLRDVEDILKEADRRMYTMKSRCHGTK